MTWPQAFEMAVGSICVAAVLIGMFGRWPWERR